MAQIIEAKRSDFAVETAKLFECQLRIHFFYKYLYLQHEKLQKQGNHDIAISRLEVLKKDIERKISKIKKREL